MDMMLMIGLAVEGDQKGKEDRQEGIKGMNVQEERFLSGNWTCMCSVMTGYFEILNKLMLRWFHHCVGN
jgi:hypothetical protein